MKESTENIIAFTIAIIVIIGAMWYVTHVLKWAWNYTQEYWEKRALEEINNPKPSTTPYERKDVKACLDNGGVPFVSAWTGELKRCEYKNQ